MTLAAAVALLCSAFGLGYTVGASIKYYERFTEKAVQ